MEIIRIQANLERIVQLPYRVLVFSCLFSWSQLASADCDLLLNDPRFRGDPLIERACDDQIDNLIPGLDSQTLGDTLSSIESLYQDQGNSVNWLLQAKLQEGDLYEVFAVIRVFEQHNVFPLLQDVIDLAGRFRSERSADEGAWIEQFRRRALIQKARYFGLWNQDFAHLYPSLDSASWNALFHDVQTHSPELFDLGENP